MGKRLKPSILLYGGVWIQMVCPASISFHHGTYRWFDGICRICYKGLVVLEKVLKYSGAKQKQNDRTSCHFHCCSRQVVKLSYFESNPQLGSQREQEVYKGDPLLIMSCRILVIVNGWGVNPSVMVNIYKSILHYPFRPNAWIKSIHYFCRNKHPTSTTMFFPSPASVTGRFLLPKG